jgi:hypothetical protein
MQAVDKIAKVDSQLVHGHEVVHEVVQDPVPQCNKGPHPNDAAKVILSIHSPAKPRDEIGHKIFGAKEGAKGEEEV